MMDDVHCDEERLLRTVDKFRLVNWLVARHRYVLRRWLLADMLTSPERPHRVADLGAGGCDIAAWLLGEAARLGLKVSVLAVEADERIAAHAAGRWRHLRGLEVMCHDATDLSALAPLDYIIGNHFLHHLEYGQIEHLFCQALHMQIRRFIFMDLLRSYPAFYLHSILAAVLCPGTFVGEDGRRSIRRGFQRSEIVSLLCRSKMHDRVRVHTMIPARIVIIGEVAGRGG